MLNQIAKYLGEIIAVSIEESSEVMYYLLTAEGRYFPPIALQLAKDQTYLYPKAVAQAMLKQSCFWRSNA